MSRSVASTRPPARCQPARRQGSGPHSPAWTFRWFVLIGSVTALAFTTRLLLMLRGGGLLGLGSYDDGVYYAAADALIHGRLPYRDFLFLQPPGIALAATPFAWLGMVTTDATGFAAGRIAFMAGGALSDALVVVILRRFGFAAATTGGLFYAVTFVAAYSERSILLEPIGTFGVLSALALLGHGRDRRGSRWAIAAGIALGVAVGFKIWYIVPAIVIVLAGRRSWKRLITGVAIGGGLIYMPFFVAAPTAMFREVVLDQLARGRSSKSALYRVQTMLGGEHAPDKILATGITEFDVTIFLLVIAVAMLVIAAATRGARLFAVLLTVDAIVLVVSPPFFLHYGALTVPMLALVVGVGVGTVASLPRRRVSRLLLACAAGAAILGLNAHGDLQGVGSADPVSSLQRAGHLERGCIVADNPAILPVMNVLSRDLAQGCQLWPDVSGWTYDADKSHVRRSDNVKWQRHVLHYLTSGSAVILLRPATGLDHRALSEIRHDPVLFRDDQWVLHATVRQ